MEWIPHANLAFFGWNSMMAIHFLSNSLLNSSTTLTYCLIAERAWVKSSSNCISSRATRRSAWSCNRIHWLKFFFRLASSNVLADNETFIGRISTSTIPVALNLCARMTHVGANFIGTRPPVTSGSRGIGADACVAAPAVACGYSRA